MLRTTGKALALLLSLASITLVSSQALGGPVSMVLVRGSSMEPAYHQGDLVLVRRAEYRPGDAVAYRSTQLNAIVLHRIVRADGDRFVFKGDNNGWLDPGRPARSELVGKHLFRLPFAGTIVAAMRTPQGIGIAVAGTALSAAAGALMRRRRRRGRSLTARPGPIEPLLPSPVARVAGKGVPLGLGMCTLVLVAVSATSFLLPTSGQSRAALTFKHTGTFTYSALVPGGPVYEGGKVSTGDPVYLNVTPSLDVRFHYRFRSDTAHDTDARARLVLEVADDTGWKHSLVLQPATLFQGDQAVLRGRLDLERIWGVIEQVQRLTGIETAAYSLAIIPEIQVTGTVADEPVDERFAPRLALRLDRLLMRLAPSATSPEGSVDETPPDPLEPSQPGAVKVQNRDRSTISMGGIDIDTAAARRLSILAALALIIGFALVTWRGQARTAGRENEVARILRRHRRWIIPVASRHARPAGTVVDVASIEDLLRLADHYGRMILHQNGDAPAAFLLEEDGTTYRYAPEHATAPVSGNQCGSPSADNGSGDAREQMTEAGDA